MRLAVNLEDLDRLVRRTGREPSAIIVEHSIVLDEAEISGAFGSAAVGGYVGLQSCHRDRNW